MATQKYQQHPIGAKLPPMSPVEAQGLYEDIKTRGLNRAIVLFEGKVLDGFHRLGCCIALGVTARFVDYNGKDPVGFVLSENIHRRHLNEGQCAMLVAESVEWLKPGNRPTPSRDGVAGRSDELAAKSTAEMAALAGVSTSTMERAKTVVEKGSEDIKEAVRSGEITVKAASDVAQTTPKRQQMKVATTPKPPKLVKVKAPPKVKAPKVATVPKAEHDKLITEYNDLRDNREDIAAELEATMLDVKGQEHVVKIKQLQLELRTCKRTRDELMTKANDLTKQCAFWRKEAEKLGWKPKVGAKK